MSLLRKHFESKNVYIVGSAPNIDHSAFTKSMSIVCVNGSLANLDHSMRTMCRVLVVDNELLNPATRRIKHNRGVVDMIYNSGLHVELVISSPSNNDLGGSVATLGVSCERELRLTRVMRRNIVRYATNDHLVESGFASLLSTGGFAIALSRFLGAASITLAGFGLYQGLDEEDAPHFYAEQEIETTIKTEIKSASTSTGRNHSLADIYLITRLVILGMPIHSSILSYKPFLSNWGYRNN